MALIKEGFQCTESKTAMNPMNKDHPSFSVISFYTRVIELIRIIFEVLMHLVRYGTVEMTAVVILSVVYLLLPGNEQ